ncbi:MAG: M24 family metallopeptidase, partial [Anaerolineae bacterium]|nr:M24 family metallopeptidase [Anaerolineae bacterium]
PLRLGETIVFDVFPYDPATGYFHDVTRTFFLGYAPDPLAERWQQVKTVFDRVLAELRIGERCARYQELVCDAFESLGYPTLRQDPKTQRGYVHSLGHGLGLDIHEPPALNLMPDNDTVFVPGHVFSVEPGLYEPDTPPDGGPGGWAIRLEDTVAFDHDGHLVNLTAYPCPMVIPVRELSG